MSHQWFYIQGGVVEDTTVGPIAEVDLVELVRGGKLARQAQVASPTRTKNQWMAIEAFPALLKIWDEGQAQRQAEKAAQQQQRAEEKARQQAARQQQRAEAGAAEDERRRQIAQISESTNYDLVERLLAEVGNILTSGESVEYIAIQQKPLNVKPDAVVCTNRRLIFFQSKLLGRFNFYDYLWRELKDAHLKQGMIGSTFTARHFSGSVISMDYLPKSAAQRLYRIAQEREEIAIEERRQREMEERRAGAANVQVNASPAAATPAPNAPASPAERLGQLKSLLDAGLLTQEEFDAKKKAILDQI